MARILVTLNRTRLQSASIAIDADTPRDGMAHVRAALALDDTAYDYLPWSDGETEGKIELDYEDALVADLLDAGINHPELAGGLPEALRATHCADCGLLNAHCHCERSN